MEAGQPATRTFIPSGSSELYRVSCCLSSSCTQCKFPSAQGAFNGILTWTSALAAGALALKINVDVETILFAIYDIFSQGILGYWLLIAHDGAPGMYVPLLLGLELSIKLTAILVPSTLTDSGPTVWVTRVPFASAKRTEHKQATPVIRCLKITWVARLRSYIALVRQSM